MRDRIAQQVLMTMLTNEYAALRKAAAEGQDIYTVLAGQAYAFADAMMKMRGRD
jgi:hypothetical protein